MNYDRINKVDLGPQWRKSIGVPGRIHSPYIEKIQNLAKGKVNLKEAKGNDADNVSTHDIWVYDSDVFSVNQAPDED